jgi:hypothetical protein
MGDPKFIQGGESANVPKRLIGKMAIGSIEKQP